MESIAETAEKGTSKRKGKEQGKSKGKNDADGTGETGRKGSTRAQNEESRSGYASCADREKNWGTLKQQEEWGEMMEGYLTMGMWAI